MHQSDYSPWGMANCIYNVVLVATKHVIQNANLYFFLNWDEVANQS